ncbi:hypothetical protein B0H16DRAFT_1603394 [Mycena metata]|uniref:Uncharacterized protein n=1 Tax=Mycena metata TaxID=1033252 RepID=A0AAD7HJ03_9AGAR|nr:hypothetical protein B0H16DRAFT_1603394 [Mycena metata]
MLRSHSASPPRLWPVKRPVALGVVVGARLRSFSRRRGPGPTVALQLCQHTLWLYHILPPHSWPLKRAVALVVCGASAPASASSPFRDSLATRPRSRMPRMHRMMISSLFGPPRSRRPTTPFADDLRTPLHPPPSSASAPADLLGLRRSSAPRGPFAPLLPGRPFSHSP